MQQSLNGKFYQDSVFWVLIGMGPLVVFGIKFGLHDLAITSLDTPAQVLSLLLIYPVLEEVVFRGAIMDGVSKTPLAGLRIAHISGPNFFSASLFSLLHLWGQRLGWALAVFIPGLVFGFSKERWGSLKFPILLHIYYNGCFFGIMSV